MSKEPKGAKASKEPVPEAANDAGADVISEAVAAMKARLQPFLTNNPVSRLREVETSDGPSLRIIQPWSDPSFSLRIPDQSDAFIDALNVLRLPTRLSAIWHEDTGDLEVIWTANNLPESQVEVDKRAFTFTFDDREHSCEFGDSSERLLVLAQSLTPITMSATFWRNLQPFSQFARLPKERHSNFGLDKPRSFWIRGVDWNEEELLTLVDNLNFGNYILDETRAAA